jgi:hypothetical protein
VLQFKDLNAAKKASLLTLCKDRGIQVKQQWNKQQHWWRRQQQQQ